MEQKTPQPSETPIPVIANVARVVTAVCDRITGDRVDVPLLVAAACAEGIRRHGIEAQVMYGKTAWVEVLEDNTVVWAACAQPESPGFWVTTQYGEVVDLNASVAHRKQALQLPSSVAALSPPMLWSREVPAFYRYQPEGIAELDLESLDERARNQLDTVLREVREKCGPEQLVEGEDPQFPNEPILCPGRRVLDDSNQSFRKFDRVLSVRGLPKAPI